jgi:hypothetical protein
MHGLGSLNNESVKISQGLDGRLRRRFKVFLLEFARLGVLVAEDEVDLQRKESAS